MRRKRRYGIGAGICMTAVVFWGCGLQPQPGQAEVTMSEEKTVTQQASMITIEIDGKIIESKQPYCEADGDIMIPVKMLTEEFGCLVRYYEGSRLEVEKNTRIINMTIGSSELSYADGTVQLQNSLAEKEETLYIPGEAIALGLYYDYDWDSENNRAVFSDMRSDIPSLPASYDMRQTQKAPQVRDQGDMGTCWAFASCEAMESSLLPGESKVFSVDHMSLDSHFKQSQAIGGDYTMALAYLASWRGPVLESSDPYGDNQTDNTLLPVKHVQEVQILPKRDTEKIKEAVYLYGAVQSSFYSALTNSKSHSEYYNQAANAYYYTGEEVMNHDIVIVGWDDDFPKENFTIMPEGNGAFLCQNSWGNEFGESGYFWVSYYDKNIGNYSVSYTRIDDIDNYSNIYQSDLCGWVGQIGYEKEESYLANVYTSQKEEQLKAVGFYATGANTEYEIYIIPQFTGTDSIQLDQPVAAGSFENIGYYTVDLEVPAALSAGIEFAVVVKIRTPGSQYPVAVEYAAANSSAENADITDGHGYISQDGGSWQRIEEKYNCNLCLKAYTD